MRVIHFFLALGMAGLVGTNSAKAQTDTKKYHIIMEGYPDQIRASREAFIQDVAAAGSNVKNVPFHLIVPTLRRWKPGQVVRVAFNGGSPAIYGQIEKAATEWITKGGANLALSFKDSSNKYRTWTSVDGDYAAEVRIAFQSGSEGGYWSHVGTDSTNRQILGGAPGQASMNFDSFDKELPEDWEATVIHEFGHALGFEHEHQNPAGGCDFRFEDDPGYIRTKDAQGWYTYDVNGRRPGLYTYLGGYKNFWPKEKVDANLRALQVSNAYLVGQFDKKSIMKYFFDSFMFSAGDKSPCYTETENIGLSELDIKGVRTVYPHNINDIATSVDVKRNTIKQLSQAPAASQHLKQQLSRQLNLLQ